MNSSNIFKQHALVNQSDRKLKAGHRAVILWFTGLSGSGKSTLAHAVEKALFELGARTFVVDGDNIRHRLCKDLGFTNEDRQENIRRVGEISKLFIEAGVITLTAFISPFQSDRNRIRDLVEQGRGIEIYCKASFAICEQRDVKGLYAKARRSEIAEFTGISSLYEPPLNPELALDTGVESLGECVNKIIKYLKVESVLNFNSKLVTNLISYLTTFNILISGCINSS
jgi:adenylylsulfate kinase